MKNTIILTSGLAGSSPVSGLISRAGLWTGETFKKSDYDTYENVDLIACNKRILESAGYAGKYEMEFSAESIERIGAMRDQLDPAPYREFVEKCNQHSPWVWKDPRLWLTIRFWWHFLDSDSTEFILLTREHLQTWISTTIRRQIQTFEYHKRYSDQVIGSLEQFLVSSGARFHRVCFEDLIVRPEETIDGLNRFLGSSLEVEDFKSIYHKPLYRKTRGFLDFGKAVLIYAKNYNLRHR